MEDGKPAELSSKPAAKQSSKKRSLARKTKQIKHDLHFLEPSVPINQSLTVSKVADVSFNGSIKEAYGSGYVASEAGVSLPLNNCTKEPFSGFGVTSDPGDIKSFLILWSKKHNISHAALNDLLKKLQPWHTSLPKDARTLLETPRSVNIVNCAGGSYVYFGLEKHLIERASKGTSSRNYPLMRRKMAQIQSTPFLSVTLNVDGLPIHSSSTHSFWPILCILDQSLDKRPFIVALYYGESKPNNAADFLRPFVDECLKLEQNGLCVNGVKFEFRVSCIIADAPARAFIKCIKSHNSLHACEKCQQEGTYLGRTVWPYSSELTLRTDSGFVNAEYEDHQIFQSILTELDVGLVTQVPLDFMHLVCLGVVKKLIRCWIEHGPKECKLNVRKIDEISRRLLLCRNRYPVEFSRRPRSLKLFKYWKATEFRAFVLYVGPVILQKIWPNSSIYKHFILLHCAIYILCNDDICQNDHWRSYANNLLHCFVQNSQIFYSEEFIVYNVHNLLHLAADVHNFGPLDLFAAFPFENFMSKIKRMVRSRNMALEQVAKRLGENSNNYTVPQKSVKVKKQGNKIKKIAFNENCILSIYPGDSCFLTISGDIVIIKSIKKTPESNSYTLLCDRFLNKSDFYKKPIESSKLGVYKVSGTSKINVTLSHLHKKCFLLPNFVDDDGSFVCIPFVSMKLHY